MKSKTLIILSVLGAFILWGAWAFFVNFQEAEIKEALRTALVQGIYSAAMTLYMSVAVVFFARKTSHWPAPLLWPVLFTTGHTGLVLVGVHLINHTPNLIKTIAAPLIVSVIYCFVIAKNHSRNTSIS